MLVASDDATAGSVIEKQDRLSASRRGSSQRSRCSSVPNIAMSSMFPVSGAEQFSASGAMLGDQPVISAIGAYSATDRPGPYLSSGINRFQRLRRLASSLRSVITSGVRNGVPAARLAVACSSKMLSAG